ncbi:MAG: AbiH family protein [Paludibacter sp.]|nr:AbiH family protein [Paludibacter sp.]
MKTIFVIGNGFDLAHDLKTSYGHFLDSIDNSKFESNDLLFILKHARNTGNWSDIEYFYFTLLKNCDNIEGYLNDNFGVLVDDYSSQRLDKDFNEIKTILEEYLDNEQKSLKLIDEYSIIFTTFNNEDTLILDFNYTDTIYKYLNGKSSGIKHIKIHGELNEIENPIIFGFAADNNQSKMLSDKNDEYLMKNIKKLCYLRTDNELKLKDMLNNSRCEEIDVFILGHSCGVSDKLILHELFNHKFVKNITIFHYNGWEGFLKTAINIDRIIDDYSKNNPEEKAFHKLNNYDLSTSMIQKDSDELQRLVFNGFTSGIITRHNEKYSRDIGFVSSFM